MPTQIPVITPTITPTTNPVPWHEQFTDPERICPQQTRETASPDIEP